MSLCCDETRRCIEYGEPLKAGTRSDVNFFSALSKEVINKIPRSKQCAYPRKDNDGVDIHEANSSLNPTGSYTLCDFSLKDFCFSITQETAEKYLPNHIKHYKKENPDRYQILKEINE
jgi:hypothetical protein